MISRLKNLLLQNTSTKQTIVKNMFWLVISQVISRFMRAFVIIYAARLLGPSEYGIFSYAIGFAAFFTIFVDMGIGTIMTREVAKNLEQSSVYFATAFWIKTCLLTLTSLFILLLGPYFSKIEAAKLLIPFIVIIIIFDNIREFINSFFRAKEKMEIEAILTIVTNSMIGFLGFIIIYYFPTSKSLTITYALGTCIGAITGIYPIRKEFAGIIKNFSLELAKYLIHVMTPVALILLIGAFTTNIDIIMLGWWHTSTDVGYYSIGQKIVQVLYTIAGIIASAIFPTLSKSVSTKNKAFTASLFKKIILFSIALSLPLTVGGIILGKPIIYFLFSEIYASSVLPFQILIINLIFVFMQYHFGNLMLAYNKQKEVVPIAVITTISNIVLSILLIPSYGIIGAAIAITSTQMIYFFLFLKSVKKIIEFNFFQSTSKIIMAVFLMSIASFLLEKMQIFVITNIVFSTIVYVIVLIILKEKNIIEILQLIKNLIRK